MSAHSLAMLMTQSASSCGAENDTSETIQRIARTDLTKPIDYTVDIERYRGVRGWGKETTNASRYSEEACVASKSTG